MEAFRTRWPGGKRATLQPASPITASIATPLIARWVNSITVWMRGLCGTTSPLQSGQWLPQPAPEPLARTYAPHKMTSRFAASTAQEKRVKLVVRDGAVVSARGTGATLTKNSGARSQNPEEAQRDE